MTRAQRLKRVFGIDVNVCVHCGGAVRILASIEEPAAIRAILAHFGKHDALEHAHYRPAARAPPTAAARRAQSLSRTQSKGRGRKLEDDTMQP